MQESKLFVTLPEYVCTPDGMEIDREGNLILSCPNYADDNLSGCVVKIDKEGKVSKWFDVQPHPETGIARNMGIAFDDDGNLYLCDNQGWSGAKELAFKGRVLKVSFHEDGSVKQTITVAQGMEHPNGIRIRNGYMYLTQSCLTKVETPSGKLLSCVYRFPLDAEGIDINNNQDDEGIFTTFITENPDCQYGADGIVFDREGNLYVGNFGDGAVWKIIVDEHGNFVSQSLYAQDETALQSTDGMIFDEAGNLYIADFSANAIAAVTPEQKVIRMAQSPDSDGLNGELNQPGEPIVWNGKIIASCFDLVTGPDKVNTGHSMPATLAQLDLL